jgi:hypothetical protein
MQEWTRRSCWYPLPCSNRRESVSFQNANGANMARDQSGWFRHHRQTRPVRPEVQCDTRISVLVTKAQRAVIPQPRPTAWVCMSQQSAACRAAIRMPTNSTMQRIARRNPDHRHPCRLLQPLVAAFVRKRFPAGSLSTLKTINHQPSALASSPL